MEQLNHDSEFNQQRAEEADGFEKRIFMHGRVLILDGLEASRAGRI